MNYITGARVVEFSVYTNEARWTLYAVRAASVTFCLHKAT